jgi:hypothetical protein
MRRYGLQTYGSGYGPVEASCDHGNEHFAPIKNWEDQDVGGWTILKWILER